jgi:hypothetical protein
MDNFQKLELVLFFLVLALLLGVFVFGTSVTGFLVSDLGISRPADFVDEDNIKADDKSITFFIDNPVLSRYLDSESMAPVLGKNATGVGFRPSSPANISVGDIVSFYQGDKIIVHRVIEKGIDEQGVYFITKGDNSDIDDGKIRFSQIDSVLVAIIY